MSQYLTVRIKDGAVSNLVCPTDKCSSQILPTQVTWNCQAPRSMSSTRSKFQKKLHKVAFDIPIYDHIWPGFWAGYCRSVSKIWNNIARNSVGEYGGCCSLSKVKFLLNFDEVLVKLPLSDLLVSAPQWSTEKPIWVNVPLASLPSAFTVGMFYVAFRSLID